MFSNDIFSLILGVLIVLDIFFIPVSRATAMMLSRTTTRVNTSGIRISRSCNAALTRLNKLIANGLDENAVFLRSPSLRSQKLEKRQSRSQLKPISKVSPLPSYKRSQTIESLSRLIKSTPFGPAREVIVFPQNFFNAIQNPNLRKLIITAVTSDFSDALPDDMSDHQKNQAAYDNLFQTELDQQDLLYRTLQYIQRNSSILSGTSNFEENSFKIIDLAEDSDDMEDPNISQITIAQQKRQLAAFQTLLNESVINVELGPDSFKKIKEKIESVFDNITPSDLQFYLEDYSIFWHGVVVATTFPDEKLEEYNVPPDTVKLIKQIREDPLSVFKQNEEDQSIFEDESIFHDPSIFFIREFNDFTLDQIQII